ncbi:glutathione S-transferase [Pontixanthobacter sp. CEM42]|uniref:glutathione S-transferase family protein n=1 Tax=Pontixanthobacter sp. CEM42 TaxID=2792077 RepID=UPI001AE03799|nr:glutathione S-transferase [Pontixanthobacter sp. CEM42]
MPHILYGAPLSLFSGKARAYLDWKGIDYVEVLATPDIHKEIIIPEVGRSVIPVVKTEDDTILQDTTKIIDHFEEHASGPSVYPNTPRQRLAALLLETYGDEWLVIPAMHYRWNYNEEWVYGEFGKTAVPEADAETQYTFGKKAAERFRGFVPMLGINETTIPAIEQSYEALLADLEAHFAMHPFLFGTRPSIGDFGLIGPLYAHLYRDPASGEIMERLAPRVAEWVRRMVDVAEPQSGEFLPDDAIPDTLLPILMRMMDEQVPYLERVSDMLAEWLAANPDTELPRAVGMADFTVEGVIGQRIAVPFSLWMVQRATDYLRELNTTDRSACDALLESISGQALPNLFGAPRLSFEDHLLKAS